MLVAVKSTCARAGRFGLRLAMELPRSSKQPTKSRGGSPMSAMSINDVSELPVRNRQSSIYLLFSRKWVHLLGLRLPIWAHVAVLLVDRGRSRATFFDVVSARPRGARSGT
ncbi:MAG TPA: hypothetical protein VFH68_13030 [Polyangia bacterium]|nr:hypothetical protein [Polyangia bacterium]